MSAAGPCQVEALEALVRGELSDETAAMVRAHADSCPGCHKELMWLRVEQDLAARRKTVAEPADRASALSLWPAIEGRLAAERQRWWRLRPTTWTGQLAAAVGVLSCAFFVQRALFHPHGNGPVHASITVGDPPGKDGDETQEMAWPVPGGAPLRFLADTQAADVEVAAGASGEARLVVSGTSAVGLKLDRLGERRFALRFGDGSLKSGHARLLLPPGSEVELSSRSGDVSVSGLHGAVQVRTASGEVRLEDVSGADVTTVSGEIDVHGAGGALRLKTVSGGAEIDYAQGAAPDLRFDSTSGDLRLGGACGKGCAVRVETISGDVQLQLDPQSSFSLRRRTVSGELSDQLGLQAGPDGLRFGGGAGLVELSTTSGDLSIQRR